MSSAARKKAKKRAALSATAPAAEATVLQVPFGVERLHEFARRLLQVKP
ncbi:MAG TPA: hypothetical protein VGO93_07180 [Candidatus Xenobia bacterium]